MEVLEDVGRDSEAKVVEDLICYKLDEPTLDRFFLTGANLEERERTEFIQFLKANIGAFTWTPYEMPRIDHNFIKHELNVLSDARPGQTKRKEISARTCGRNNRRGRLGGAPPARPPSAATNPFSAYLHRPSRPPPSFSHAPTPPLSSSSKSLSLSCITLRKRPKSLASAPISAAYSSSNDETERAKLAQVSKRLENTAIHFKRLGSLGFWGQLVCTVVASVILAFSVVITGKITSPATFYATAGGIVAAFISVFWSFGYVRMSDKLRKTANDLSKAPPRADVVKSLKNGIVLNLLGMGAAVLGIQATVGSLVAKALTSSSIPYYQGT
ncbi:translocon at inner membrane of chloroplasts 21 [Actinidia rufa]|uniref:Translocon at inner membrane of chloroplasts 21 n=1 Tax=Actinidia rufa TaxID=165716 RepID=A0A7J0DBF8_9ERIC|nr:translocon at inner membrane of chloroplasts 21 [Actinidia rufa]